MIKKEKARLIRTPQFYLTTLNYNKLVHYTYTYTHKIQSTTKRNFPLPQTPSNPTIVLLIDKITHHITICSYHTPDSNSILPTVYYTLIHFPISRGTRERCVCVRNSTNPMHFYGIRSTRVY